MKSTIPLLFTIFMSMPCVMLAEVPSNATYPSFSGIYPHLASFNNEGECGTGAVVPWADRLWYLTYGPHCVYGSSDKLYEVDAGLNLTVRPESIGGTHANRMIHRESEQLFMGYYIIDKERNIRVIKPKDMPGRQTGNARHLASPADKIYYATMEEGLYEVDVRTLDITTLYKDGNVRGEGYTDILPGYHGKGLYSAQGRVVYANNGENSPQARINPVTPSGCLASWDGTDWTVVLRNQFTEVTGPGGIFGNADPDDRLWSVGWDHRSVMLMLMENGTWTKYRLPKASHCYDGAHGWNTEWPRIREINQGDDLLMTMHGTFWRFPKNFSRANAAGIRPRSTYLKVIGDFCVWNGKIVFGCDDTAKAEFLNKSPFKANLAGPGQSNSNLWFVEPELLDNLGPAQGRGAVWFEEPVKANIPSDPFLFAGYDYRALWISHDSDEPVEFTLEVDRKGDGNWEELVTYTVKDNFHMVYLKDERAKNEFMARISPALRRGEPFKEIDTAAEWVRIRANKDLKQATCYFQFSNEDKRSTKPAEKFAAIATPDCENYHGGLLWMRPDNQRLAVVSQIVEANRMKSEHYYELTAEAKLVRVETGTITRIKEKVTVQQLPENVYTIDDCSVICTHAGQQYRLPFGCEKLARTKTALPMRLDREVATERDLFYCAGTFYELPAINAGGLPKIRPVSTPGKLITDYASYRGLMILTGLDSKALDNDPHVIRSDDGNAAVWAGCIDDLWEMGKPVGHGAVWKDEAVKAGVPSLPFLMTGFDRKTVTFTNHGDTPTNVTLEVDITGTGVWKPYMTLPVPANDTSTLWFALQAYWVRAVSDADARLTAEIRFE